MTHRLATIPIALLATLLLAATALAGGWATVALDPGTADPQAGTPVTLGFRVLQHGQTPNSSLNVVLRGSSAGGGSVFADATAKGEIGHYVATLTFPSDGAWTISWTSELDMAGSTATLNVTPVGAAPAPAAPVAAAPVVSPTLATTAVQTDTLALAVGGIVLALAVVGGLLALRRRRTRTSVPSVG